RDASGSVNVALPNHVHGVQFGLSKDNQTPYNITFEFEGNDVTQDLFGVDTLAPTGGNINEVADAGNLANLLTNAAGGLQQLHELTIKCASGRGEVRCIIEVFATTQAIKLPNT
ncbi:MAG: hypothetical protein AAFQ07_14935, partial [Chloroflexota bacterium]